MEEDTIEDLGSIRRVLRRIRRGTHGDKSHKVWVVVGGRFLDMVPIHIRQTRTRMNLTPRKEIPTGSARILALELGTLPDTEYSRRVVHMVVATSIRRKRKVSGSASVPALEMACGIQGELVLV